MRINELQLVNIRNYKKLKISFTDNINIFVGENAQGKTNIVEALYFGAMGRSHRTSNDQEMIRWHKEKALINIQFSRLDVQNELTFKLTAEQNKQINYNGHNIKPKELIGALNVVLFSPEDLALIKGMPVNRRRFLDIEISQASPVYYRQLQQYNRILLQRNNLLKKIREGRLDLDHLYPWDEQLAAAAVQIVIKRKEAVKKLTMLANLMHRKITDSKENLTISYQQIGMTDEFENQNLREWYLQMLSSQRQTDTYRGSTSTGPHRDDLILTVNGANLRTYGSQGQQRTGVLALKLAELEYLKSETGEYPVLLLDDVMSELDASRREQLLLFIKDRIQTFITATEIKYFPSERFGRFFHVLDGNIQE